MNPNPTDPQPDLAQPGTAQRVALANVGPEKSEVELRVQILAAERKETKTQKPFYELKLSDGSATEKLRVWDNHPSFADASAMKDGSCYSLNGTFWMGDYGLEGGDWSARLLEGDERTAVFAGPAAQREKQAKDWSDLLDIVAGLPEGSLKTIACALLSDYAELYRRAGAARGNHHARRGGLVEHVAWMAKSAVAMCGVYPELRRDLMVAAVVFHDAGKIVENQYEPSGFEMPFSFRAEAFGHIIMGIELARALWAKLPAETQLKDKLLFFSLGHCIAAHHGQLQWGSPLEPKSPEAIALHCIDNLDAKLEMMRAVRATGKLLAPGVLEGPYVMRCVLVTPEVEA